MTMDLTKIAECLQQNIERRREARMEEIRREEKDFFDQLRAMKLSEEQIYGVEWISATYDLGLSCILGDEMGVGKTVQAICFLLRLREKVGLQGPFLIAVPLAVLETWMQEFKKWMDIWCEKSAKKEGFKIQKYYGHGRVPPLDSSQIVLTAHTTFSGEYDVISSQIRKWNVVIVDEAHRAKDDRTYLSKSIPLLEADMYLLLSGTIVHNNIDREFARMLELVMPRPLTDRVELQVLLEGVITIDKGTRRGKKKQEEEDDDEEEDEDQGGGDEEMMKYEGVSGERGTQLSISKEQLRATKVLLKCFRLRRSLKNAALKGKKTCRVYVPMTKLQKQIYAELKEKNEGEEKEKPHLFEKRLCDLHPFMYMPKDSIPDVESEKRRFIDGIIAESNKVQFILSALEILVRGGRRAHKVLIFSQSRPVLFMLSLVIKDKGYRVETITGLSAEIYSRQAILNKFNERDNDEIQILLLSTRAMAEGLQMQGADTVIFHDHDYNPQTDNQAEGRAYRTGQERPVLVLRLVIQKSSEENTLNQRISSKRTMQGKLEYDHQNDDTRDTGENQGESVQALVLNPSELRKLLLSREDYHALPKIKEKDDEEVIWKPTRAT